MNYYEKYGSVKKMNRIKSRNLIQRFERKKFIIYEYYPFITVGYLIFIFISWLFYPEYSSIYPISNLGNWFLNPSPGWIFFSFGSFWEGTLLIPFYICIRKKLDSLNKNSAWMGTTANLIGSIGLIVISFFPNIIQFQIIHETGAFLAFSGFFMGNIFYYIALLKLFKKERKFSLKMFIFALATIFIPILTGIFIFQYFYTNILGCLNPLFEWIMFFLIIFQALVIYILIPEKPVQNI